MSLLEKLKKMIQWEIRSIKWLDEPPKKTKGKLEELLYKRMENRFAQIAHGTPFLIDLDKYLARCKPEQGAEIYCVDVVIEKKRWVKKK